MRRRRATKGWLSYVGLVAVVLGWLAGVSPMSATGETVPGAVRLKVAVVSMNAKLDREGNLATMTSYIKQGAEQGAHLIVIPEGCVQGNPAWGLASYQPTGEELRYVRDTAETVPGPSTDRLVQVARTYHVFVIFGLTEKGPDGSLYTTSVLLGPNGVLGSHRKTRLWNTSAGGNEHLFWQPGTKLDVVESPLGKVGLMICIEMYYDLGPSVSLAGADFLVTVSHWPRGPVYATSYDSLYEIHSVSNAVAASRWHFVANQVGLLGHAETYGHARVIDPHGTILADTGTKEGMVIVETDRRLTPMVDFNGDGKVDEKDMAILLANWGRTNSVCDVGPYPWGDGVVDEKDLSILMKQVTGMDYVRSPLARASEIPCDVSLTWTAVPFASSYDVYLGTSLADVNSADRAHPKSVLVNQGQTVTTCKPQNPLSYGQTYYWRVDFVGAGPAPTIYKGCVLDFTTEGTVRLIQDVTATASSAQPSMGPNRTVDGSGIDKNDGHSTNGTDMWLSTGSQPNWIQYQFDKVYALHELWVWNSNQPIEPLLGFGAKTVKIEYSTDGTKWTQLANAPEFARASGQSGYVHNTTVSFGGVSAEYVKLTIEKNWGAAQPAGLSEVRFFYIPDRAAAKP